MTKNVFIVMRRSRNQETMNDGLDARNVRTLLTLAIKVCYWYILLIKSVKKKCVKTYPCFTYTRTKPKCVLLHIVYTHI